MGEADIAAISALLEAASVADGHRALGEHQWLDLVQGGREGFAGFVAREAGRERIIAYAQIVAAMTRVGRSSTSCIHDGASRPAPSCKPSFSDGAS